MLCRETRQYFKSRLLPQKRFAAARGRVLSFLPRKKENSLSLLCATSVNLSSLCGETSLLSPNLLSLFCGAIFSRLPC